MLTPDMDDPTINLLYRDVLAHYGVVALPCRVGDPDRKGKVEAGIGHAQKTPLKGLRFETIAAGRKRISIAGRRTGPTRGSTAPRNAKLRRCLLRSCPALGPLPIEPFRYYRFGVRTVHSGGLRRSRSGILRRATWRDRTARPGAVERSARAAAGAEDRPNFCVSICERRAAGTGSTPTIGWRARRRAPWRCSPAPTSAGPSISAVCTYIHQHDGAAGVRRMLGVLALAKKHGPAIDDAGRESGARSRRADLSLSPSVSRTPSTGAADAAPGRSPHSAAHPLSRSHRSQKQETRYESRRARSRPP